MVEAADFVGEMNDTDKRIPMQHTLSSCRFVDYRALALIIVHSLLACHFGWKRISTKVM